MNAQKIRRLIATGMVLAVSSGMVACKDKTVAVKKQENNNNDKNEEENKEQEQEVFTEEDKKKEELDNLEIENIKGKHGSFVVTKYKEKKQGKILNIQTYLNVRTEPTKSAEAIEKLHNDDTVNVLGKTGEWYQIELNEKVGYIHSNYVRVEGEAYNYNPDMDKTSVYVQDSQVNNSGIVYVTPVTSEDNTNPNIVVKPSKPTTSNKPSTSNKPNVKPEEKPTTPSTPNKPGDKPEEKPSTPEEKPVENTAPVITGNSLEIKGLNSTFTVEMLELKATDKEDGDLTSKIVIEENTVDTSKTGEYKVVASVTDSQGLKTTVEIKVTVVEVKDDVIVEAGVINSAPVITGKDITIEQYSTFNKDMLEIKCEDKEDGTLTYEVIKNNVNVAEAGTYDFTVKATDGKGASTMKTFKVTVTAKKLNTAPVIHVTNKQVDLAVGDTWSLDLHGVTATDAEDGVITDIRVDGTVDTSKAGTYFVDLVAVDSEELISGRVTLTVIVHEKSVDINSVPTMEVKNETVTLVKGDKWSLDLHGVSANDKEDGKLEVKVEGKVDTNTVGTYKITVTAVDSQGAKVVRQLTVIVNDKKNSVPVITAQDIQINKGQRYDVALHNAQATDAEDGVITDIRVDGTVDTSKAGTYFVDLVAVDSEELISGRVTLTVIVHEKSVDINSVPTMEVKNETVTLVKGDKWSLDLHGVSANDKEDGKLEVKVEGKVDTNTVGTYKITVTAVDSQGAKVVRQLTVIVNDKKNSVPVITAQDIQINKGQRYDVALHNAQATDAEDGNLTSKITYTTTVDTTRVGKYQTTFKVQDSQGVEASITVNV